MKQSFAQTGEDLIVDFVCGERGIQRPSYLDIGAYHPYELSNTALFHRRGGSGITVEPDPAAHALLASHRATRTLNLNVGCGPEPGRLTFYRMSVPTLSTFSRESAQEAVDASGGAYRIVDELVVDVLTVPEILERNGGACPDLLSLDVEGLDLQILQTMPQWQDRPKVVCVETITYSQTGRGRKLPEIGDLMDGLGYLPFADTYINTIFVQHDFWVR